MAYKPPLDRISSDMHAALQQRGRRSISLAQRDALYGYLFVTPQVVGFLTFVLGPLIAVILFSFQERNLLSGRATFVGLANYQQMVAHDPLFAKTLINSLVFTAGLVPLNVGMALLIAVLLNHKFVGSTIFRTVFFAPVVTSAAAWAIVWRFMLQGENGTINQWLAVVGIDGPNWLREPGWVMASVIGTRVLKSVGMNMIILLAALQSVPHEYHEAAWVDGATHWYTFGKITLPLLAPTILMVTVITVIGSLQVFDHIQLLTQGGPANATMVLVYYIYYQGFSLFETGYASALAVFLFLVAVMLTLFQWASRKKVSYNEA